MEINEERVLMRITKRQKTTYLKWAFLIVAILPILFTIVLIVHYAVNVPTFDQWDLVDYFQDLQKNQLSIGSLLLQHNEHRIFFPRIAMLSLGVVSHWNIIVEMLASVAIQIISFVFIWKAIKRTLSGIQAQIVQVVAAILMFNPMQWENWLWGWQIQWYLTILGAIAALYFCWYMPLRQRQLNHVLSVAGATLATFSLAGGMVVWLCMLVILLFRKQTRALGMYSVVFIVEVLVYARNYHSIAGHTPLNSLYSHQLEFFRYIFLYLGGSLSGDKQIAPIIGAIGLGIFLVLSIRAFLQNDKKSYFWIALGLFVILNAVLTGSGRFLLGSEQALASRYTTFSVLWLLSLLMIAAPYIFRSIIVKSNWLQPIAISLTLVVIGLVAMKSLGGIDSAKAKSKHDKIARACLNAEAVPSSACLSMVYPSTPETDARNREHIEYLRSQNYAGMKKMR